MIPGFAPECPPAQKRAKITSMRALCLVAVAIHLLGCKSQSASNLQKADDAVAPNDASPTHDGPTDTEEDALASCFPLFHGCATTAECCAPNRCLNVTGTPACQLEGPKDAAIAADSGKDATQATTACFSLFHACTESGECCAPNRCLNITGTLECQQEGPAPSAP